MKSFSIKQYLDERDKTEQKYNLEKTIRKPQKPFSLLPLLQSATHVQSWSGQDVKIKIFCNRCKSEKGAKMH